MRLNRDILAVCVLLLIFVVVGAALSGHDSGQGRLVGQEEHPDPSVFNDRASGTKGLFDWVGALGDRPTVWRQGWGELGHSQASLLIVAGPRAEADMSPLTGGDDDSDMHADKSILSPSDATALLSWLRAGHMALLMASRLPTGHVAGHKDGAQTFGDALDIIANSAIRAGRVEYGPLQPVPQTRGVVSIHSEADSRLRRTAPDGIALFGDSNGPLALSVPVGKGRLVVIADSEFASNRNLPRSENAVFLAHVLAQGVPPGGTVLFDEYHHGDIALASGATLWTALGRPAQLALTQGVLALLLVVGVVAVRFGQPVPLGRGQSRTSVEYVASLAGLYRRAKASPAALETLYRQFLRDLSARLALAPTVNLEQLSEVAARHGGVDKEALRRLLTTCEQRLDSGAVSEPELLELTRQMEAVRKDLGLA
jgi:hypothetical protein